MDLQTVDQCIQAGRDALLFGSAAKDFIPEWVKEKFKGKFKQLQVEKNIENTLTLAKGKMGDRKQDSHTSFKVIEEVLEACSDEDRTELQELWAALLARIATGEGRSITKEIISIVKSFEPIDALVLKTCDVVGRTQFNAHSLYQHIVTNVPSGSQYHLGDITASCRRLFQSECFDYVQKGIDPTQRFTADRPLQLAYQGANILRVVGDIG
ncbi:hypothetical protein Gdia_0572 [Gluconacetobacter diazotrophicus PA1 5]|uniref:Abi-alpha family protein n=1 Tax=Gluconacetobacter diazotrophicus TaxID=33996 RepID=UPI000181EFB5|nr:hypothetical protein [Gluconacetobacter diazotrophicus]ACI50364.1 hypothetical protein Gdia_0572 [Gluconacetobacter diazotrophicus PA1 5]